MPLPQALRADIALRDGGEREFGRLPEAQWNMLVDLTRARLEGWSISVTSACIASRVPPTTALRHIGLLIEAGLIVREPDQSDGRRFWLRLTDIGFERVNAAFGFEPFALARVA